MLPRRVSHPIQPANARTSATRNRLTPSPYGARAAVDEDLRDFEQIPLDTNATSQTDAADGVSLLHVAQAGFTPDPTSEREEERNTQQADPVALRQHRP
jgi:hypothetical protein